MTMPRPFRFRFAASVYHIVILGEYERRHLHEYQNNNMDVASLSLAHINQLYEIERRGANLSDEERGALCKKDSRMLLDRLHTFLYDPEVNNLLPSLKLSEALNYLRNH